LGLEASSFFQQKDLLRAIPVSIGAFLSFLAAMRFILQNLIEKIGRSKWRK